VSLVTTALTPCFLISSQVIIDHHLVLVVISLLQNSLNHGNSFLQVFISLGCDLHVQGFILISFLLVVDSTLCSGVRLGLNHAYLVLGSLASDLYSALAFLLQFLLSLSTWTNDLSNVVQHGVVLVWDLDLLHPLRSFVVRRSL
jgi:hypothetical protein